MDEKPFLELDLLDIDEHVVPELVKLTKSAFDVDSIVSAAGELKFISQIKKMISSQFSEPDEDFVKLFASRVYDGILTQKVREQFSVLTKKAATQWLNDQVNERLKSAISGGAMVSPQPNNEDSAKSSSDKNEAESGMIVTTEMEIEGFHIIKSIIRKVIEPQRITFRDTQSYLGILIDDNNRKPICRLHFNRSQLYIGMFDGEKKETRHPITSLNDIYNFTDLLRDAAKQYC